MPRNHVCWSFIQIALHDWAEDGVHQPPLAYHAACSDFAIESGAEKFEVPPLQVTLAKCWEAPATQGLNSQSDGSYWGWRGQRPCRQVEKVWIHCDVCWRDQFEGSALHIHDSFASTSRYQLCRSLCTATMYLSSRWAKGLQLRVFLENAGRFFHLSGNQEENKLKFNLKSISRHVFAYFQVSWGGFAKKPLSLSGPMAASSCFCLLRLSGSTRTLARLCLGTSYPRCGHFLRPSWD